MDCVWADHLNYFPIMLSEMRNDVIEMKGKVNEVVTKIDAYQSDLSFIKETIVDNHVSSVFILSKLFFYITCEILKGIYSDTSVKKDGSDVSVNPSQKYLLNLDTDYRQYFYVFPAEGEVIFDTWIEPCTEADSEYVGLIDIDQGPFPYHNGGYAELQFYFVIRKRDFSSLLRDSFNSNSVIVPDGLVSSVLKNILGNFSSSSDFSQLVSKNSLFHLLLKDILINQHTNFLCQADIAKTHSKEFLNHLLDKAREV